jgi:cell division septation protein DedD
MSMTFRTQMSLRMSLHMGLFALFFFATTLLQAAPAAVVEGVQLPAWFTRDGKRQPLATGIELGSNDERATGVNSRLLLRLGDGSMVKLGENGQLRISGLTLRRQQNFISATLKVLEGAFRFTTAAVQSTHAKRDITVEFQTITAGIRGTDIWGKNLGDREVLVLIEGKITVARAGDAPVEMKDPLTYLQAPKAGAATVEAVLMEQLKAWAAETEIATGQGAIRKGGRWKLYLASYDRQTEALALYDSLRRDGYPALILPQAHDDIQRYRVRIAGFPSEQEANALGARLKEMHPRLEPIASLR